MPQASRSQQPGPGGVTRLGERATALILVPAMMIVFICLASIAVDLSAIHMEQRRAHAVISAAADDAAGMLDEAALQTNGTIRLDPEMSVRVARSHIEASALATSLTEAPKVDLTADGTGLMIEAKVRVEHIFLDTFPGIGSEVITVRSSARMVR